MKKTCGKKEYLLINREILEFAQELLDADEMQRAERISNELALPKYRNKARNEIRAVVGMRPKRPLYYLNSELAYLPRCTRDSVRYLGDYIDHLVKFLSSDIYNDSKYMKKSLGINAKKLDGKISEKLLQYIRRYNEIIYVPAKHDLLMEQHKERKHRFTSKEVVYICFITMNLSSLIIEISDDAKKWSMDEYSYS